MAALPNMSAIFSQKRISEFVGYVELGVRNIIFWSLPISVLFIVLRAQIVRVVLGAGQFDWSSTRLVAASLALFSVSVVAQGLINFFSMAYYSAGLTKKPVVARVVGSLLIIILTVVLYKLMNLFLLPRYFMEAILRVENVPGTDVLSLPLAFSLGSLINMALILYYFVRDFGNFSKDFYTSFFHSLSASIIMGFVSYQFLKFFASLYVVDTFVEIFLQGFLAGVAGIAVAVLILYLLDNKELKEIVKAAQRRFWRSNAIIPGPESF